MKTTEQRISALHQRTAILRHRKERSILYRLAVVSLILLLSLMRLTWISSGSIPEARENLTGASLLNENAGGFVMTAVLAFMAGVCLTVFVIRMRYRDHKEKTDRKFRE